MTRSPQDRPNWLPPVIALIAGAIMVADGRSAAGQVAMGVALLAFAVVWRVPALTNRWLQRIQDLVTLVIGLVARVVLTLVHLVTIVPGWLIHRVRSRFRAERSGWFEVGSTSRPPRIPYEVARRTARRRVDLALALVVLTLLGAVAVAAPSTRGATGGVITDRALLTDSPAALSAQADASLVLEEQQQVFAARISDPQLGWRLGTVHGSVVNEVSGERFTPVPSSAQSTALRVWFFGASALWGFGQRDRATTPARFAALATARGIPVVARNFAVPAYTSDQSSRSLVRELAKTDAPPDLVVFVDGYNEFAAGMASTLAGVAPGTPFLSFGGRGSTGVDNSYRGRPVTLSQRYAGIERAVAPARRRAVHAAQAVGVTVVFARQPDVHSGPLRAGEALTLEQLGWSATELRAWAVADRQVRNQLPASVLDLGSVFDGQHQPIYLDAVHTNERGADVVARALLDALWGRLYELQAHGASG